MTPPRPAEQGRGAPPPAPGNDPAPSSQPPGRAAGLRPPGLARLLVTLTAHPGQRDAQLGDLQEELEEQAEAGQPEAARRWYWKQALGSALPNLGHRLRSARRRIPQPGGDDMRGLAHDLRFALRSALGRPAFTVVVVATLALGIGATTTIFGAVHGLVLRPFPFPEPDRIVGIGTVFPRLGAGEGFVENLSPAEFVDLEERTRTLQDVVAWDMGNRQIAGEGPPQNVFTAFWWGDALRTLGMDAHLGRGFSDEEVSRGAPVAVLSHRIWRDRFGADSSMVGGALLVNGTPHTLVGVLPEGVLVYGTDLWTVMPVTPTVFPRDRRQFQILGRLGPGVALAEVNTELEALARTTEGAFGAEFPEYGGWSMRAVPWSEVSSRAYRGGAFVLLGAVGFVLLLVCANTANLLLARGQRRRREMAVRTAMGAGRGRLVGQLFVESLVLALLGGAGGVGVAVAGMAGIRAFLATLSVPVAGTVTLNGPVLAFTAAVAVAAGLLFGTVPAWTGSRTGLAGVLQAEGKGATAGRSRQRLQRTFVAVEVALAFVLLAGCGLLIHSFVRLSRVSPGFDTAGVLSMRLTLPREEYEGPAVTAFFSELTERVEAVPGVRSAAAGTQFPPNGAFFRDVFVEGSAPAADASLPRGLGTVVTPGWFETLGIRLLAGRPFDGGDRAGAPRVVVVNEAAARRWFGPADPVGRRLRLGGGEGDPWWEVVGVVASTRNRGLERPPEPEIFAVHDQVGGGQNQLFLLVRSEGDPAAVLAGIREVVARMDPDQPVYAIQTVEEAFRTATASRRATTLFLSVFAAFALVLAAVGIYAVVSLGVTERTREIGLRLALGADPGGVRRLVVRQALVPVLVGATVGVGLAVPLAAGLQRLLFEVSGTDPLTFGSAALLLVAVAGAASLVPAWRASRLDPVEALRVD